MSSHGPIEIDPKEPPWLADAVIFQPIDIPKEIRPCFPPEAAPTSTPSLLEIDVPNRLPDTSIIYQSDRGSLGPCWTVDELFKTSLPPRTSWLYDLEQRLTFNQTSISPKLQPVVPILGREFLEHGSRGRRAEGSGPRDLLKTVLQGLRLWSLAGHDKVTRVGYLTGLLSSE